MKKYRESIEQYLTALGIKDFNFQSNENYIFYGLTVKNPALPNSDSGIGIYFEKPELFKFTISLCKVKPSIKNYRLISSFNTEYPWYTAIIDKDILAITHTCFNSKDNTNFVNLLDFIIGKIYGSDNSAIKELVENLE